MVDADGELRFACPECAETLAVNDPMREALLRKGCVVCGSPVTADDFSRTPQSASC